MDESTLLNQLKILESAWGALDHWLNFWVALVVIGVAMEVIVVIVEYRDENHDFMRGIIRPPDKPKIWLFIWGMMGAGLVAIGVSGEFWIHIRAGKIEAAMRDKNRSLVALINERAARASRDAAELQVKANELEEQLLEQGPRNLLLYGNREEKFMNAISQFKGQKVQVRICPFGINEVRDTAERLTALFKSAGWDVSPHSSDWGESNCMILAPNEPTPMGIWVGTPNSRPTLETQKRAKELVGSLGQIPLAASLHPVRVETARASESRVNIQGQYGAPDDIVVTILGHEEVAMTAERATKLASDVAGEQAETAEAQRRTTQGLRWVTLGVNWRTIDQKRCVELLKDKPIGTAEFWYVPDDNEASFFASGIYSCADKAGWRASKPQELPAKDVHEFRTNSGTVLPLDEPRRSAYTEGLAYITAESPSPAGGPPGLCSGLFEAISLSKGGFGSAWGSSTRALPENHCVFIVGPHVARLPLIEPPPKKQPTKSTAAHSP